MIPYDYPPITPRVNLRLKQTARLWTSYSADFPVAQPTRYMENNTAYGEYFRPNTDGNVPLVILSHGWGNRSVVPCKLLARALAKRGIACFLLYLVFHSSRLPEEVRNRLPELTAEEWFSGYQMSVVDIRQIIDWAITVEGISREHIAVMGLSLGGIISAIAMAVDERIKAGVLMVTGGNSEKIVQTSRISAFRKHYKRSEAEYNEIQECYLRYLAEVAKRGFENVTPDMNSFLTDPLTFAHLLRQRPLLMINARWDEFIPKEATLDFWEACDKPSISWYPATHPSIWLWYPLILRQITGFIKSTFEP